jgi:hypothetical protein
MDTRRYLIALAIAIALAAPVVAFADTPGHGGSHPTGFGASVGAQAGLQATAGDRIIPSPSAAAPMMSAPACAMMGR